VLKKIEKTSFKVAKYPYGVDEKVKDFETTVLLQQQSGKPQVVGIVGLGGVGKTTLAKELFNRKSSHYSNSCFLSNAREHGDEKSVIFLQKKLFRSLTGSDLGTDNIHEAIEIFKRHPFQALIILDDVDHVNQVYAILTFQIVLSSDSLVLITSRDRDVLTGSGVQNSSIYNLSGLNTQQSRELFCSHAFGRRHPLPGFESLVDGYLKACDGLPLSLKVLGADLFGKNDRGYWEKYLDRLQQILPYDIQKILKISYDRLDREEKEIFLDIASFFVGEKMDMAIRIWDGSGWQGWLSFQNLQNKSLVEVDSDNKIKMHDHLRDIGRTEASGLPRRFWRWTENTDGLQLSVSVHIIQTFMNCYIKSSVNFLILGRKNR
jgi:GTPase SAR1 family protein